MDQNKALLLAELPGLEAAKAAIDQRIEEIRQLYLFNNGSAPRKLTPIPPGDPNIIGRDTLGRIITRRKNTPEVREQRRKQLAEARQKKLEQFAALKEVSK